MKHYTLMHKNISVASFELDESTGTIAHIEKVFDIYHVPVGIPAKNGSIDRGALNQC